MLSNFIHVTNDAATMPNQLTVNNEHLYVL